MVATVTGAGPAQANDGKSLADRVAGALARTGADRASAVSGGGGTVNVNTSTPSASVNAEGTSVTIGLVGSPAEVSRTGSTASYGGVARDTDAVVRPVNSGVQLLSVMHTPAAPTSQAYQLSVPAGSRLVPAGNGFLLVSAEGKVTGLVAAPWARDAGGRSLPTKYVLTGTTLVQQTDTTGATYPVVADPKITIGLGVYFNAWGHELKAYAIAIVAVIGTGVAISCTLISRIPNAVLRSLATLLCGAAAINLRSVFDAIVRIYHSNTVVDGWCYQMKIAGPGSPSNFVRVNASNCQ